MPIDVSNVIAACSVIICPPVAHYSLIQTTGLTPSIYLVSNNLLRSVRRATLAILMRRSNQP